MEIFVRPMRDKGCHQAHNAQVVICAFFTTPNSLKLQGAAKGVFTHSQSSCHIAKVVLALTADKSSPRLTRHLTKLPAVSSIGGLRTPAPVCAAPPSWGRHPQTFTIAEHANHDNPVGALRVTGQSARSVSGNGSELGAERR